MIRTLEFDGKTNYIALGSTKTALSLIKDNFTIEAWVRQDKNISQTWTSFIGIIQDTAQNEKGWMLGITLGRYTFGLSTDNDSMTYLRSKKTIKDENWHHIAAVYDGQKMYIYIDGVRLGAAIKTGKISYPENGEFVIGAFKTDNEFYPFRGNLSNIRLWNRARTDQEIKADMAKKLEPIYNLDIGGYWILNEGAGTKIKDLIKPGQSFEIEGKKILWKNFPENGGENAGPPADPPYISPAATYSRVWDILDTNYAVSFPETKEGENPSFIKVEMQENDTFEQLFPAEKFTVEAWIFPYDTNDACYIGIIEKSGEQNRGWRMGVREKKFYFAVSGIEKNSGSQDKLAKCFARAEFMPKKWHHLAGVYSSKRIDLYIDGILEASSVQAKGAVNYPYKESADFLLGAHIDSEKKAVSCRAMISDIRLWNKALSGQIEKRKDYRIADPQKEKNLIGYWPMAGYIDKISVDTANRRDGTFYGKTCLKDAGKLCLYWPLENIKQIVYGRFHTLALKKDGSVWACGANSMGQLGDGTYKARRSPVIVKDEDGKNSLKNIKQIVAGYFHSLALDQNGNVWVWGSNWFSQLGSEKLSADNQKTSPFPVRIEALNNVETIDSTGNFNLAIKCGQLWGWGANDKKQLGDRAKAPMDPAPKQIYFDGTYLKDIKAIAAEKNQGTALDKDGKVWGWGDNKPFRILEDKYGNQITGITSVKAGLNHTIALEDSGWVWGWGDNNFKQIADTDAPRCASPVRMKDRYGNLVDNAVSISARHYFSRACLFDKTKIKWGKNRSLKKKGRHITSLAAGNETAFAVIKDGTLWHWGGWGVQSLPAEIPEINGTQKQEKVKKVSVSVGDNPGGEVCGHTLALLESGRIMAWGENKKQQCAIGQDKTASLKEPAYVLRNKDQKIENIVDIACGEFFSIALTEDRTVLTWGWNQDGRLGLGWNDTDENSIVNFPKKIQTLTEIKSVTAMAKTGLVLKNNGTLWAWGKNNRGQTGQLDPGYCINPLKVNLENVIAVSGGFDHALALKENGTVWAWGDNSYGQLGTGKRVLKIVEPVQVTGPNGKGFLENIIAISAGWNHCMALRADGTVWTWGANQNGQLGNGTLVNSGQPVMVKHIGKFGSLVLIKLIAAGRYNSYALDHEGNVWAWGSDRNRACGSQDEKTPKTIPIKVSI